MVVVGLLLYTIQAPGAGIFIQCSSYNCLGKAVATKALAMMQLYSVASMW